MAIAFVLGIHLPTVLCEQKAIYSHAFFLVLTVGSRLERESCNRVSSCSLLNTHWCQSQTCKCAQVLWLGCFSHVLMVWHYRWLFHHFGSDCMTHVKPGYLGDPLTFFVVQVPGLKQSKTTWRLRQQFMTSVFRPPNHITLRCSRLSVFCGLLLVSLWPL